MLASQNLRHKPQMTPKSLHSQLLEMQLQAEAPDAPSNQIVSPSPFLGGNLELQLVTATQYPLGFIHQAKS